MTSNFSLSSTLANTQYSVLLTNWIGKPFAKFDLIYKATRDGFKAADFHRCCDQKGFMVSIIRSEHGHVFGAYTELHWESSSSWKNDPNAFLFSLTKQTKITQTGQHKTTNSFYCHSSHGLSFGGGHV